MILAAHASELAVPGDYVRVTDDLVLANIDGEVIAFDGLCPHRGAPMLRERRGNAPAECAYHGRRACPRQLRRYHLESHSGFIFVAPDAASAPELDDLLLGLLEQAGPDLQLHATLSFPMDCDWRTAVDNALDLEHVEHVHRDSLAKLKLSRADLIVFPDGSSIEAFRSGEAAALDAVGRMLKRPRAFDYIHAHLFPNTCLSSTGGWTWSLQNYFPRADGGTDFLHRLYVRPGTPAWFAREVARLNEQVFREDAAICAGIPVAFVPNLGPRDDRIRHFRSHT